MRARKVPAFTYDPTWKPKISRKTGRANWDSPYVQARIRAAFEAGLTMRQMGEAWGINFRNVQFHLCSRGLSAIPSDRMEITEVAALLDLSQVSVHGLCRRLGMTMGHWGKFRTLNAEQVAELQSRPQIVRERPAGYVTVAELAKSWNVTNYSVLEKVKGLHRLAWVGDGPRVKFLYRLRDATARAPKVGQTSCPAGHWTGAEVAAAIGAGPRVTSRWPSLGCPHVKGRKNIYYNPVLVAEWLRTRKKNQTKAYGQLLKQAISQMVAA